MILYSCLECLLIFKINPAWFGVTSFALDSSYVPVPTQVCQSDKILNL